MSTLEQSLQTLVERGEIEGWSPEQYKARMSELIPAITGKVAFAPDESNKPGL